MIGKVVIDTAWAKEHLGLTVDFDTRSVAHLFPVLERKLGRKPLTVELTFSDVDVRFFRSLERDINLNYQFGLNIISNDVSVFKGEFPVVTDLHVYSQNDVVYTKVLKLSLDDKQSVPAPSIDTLGLRQDEFKDEMSSFLTYASDYLNKYILADGWQPPYQMDEIYTKINF
jgi:hypothetical protein